MKKLIIALVLSSSAFAQEMKCDLKLKYSGTYYNQCPVSHLADGVDVRVSGGQFPFTTVIVRCVKPEIVCTSGVQNEGTTKVLPTKN